MSSFSSGRQRGDVLLEALIGVLITALIGAGMARVASGILKTQHDTAVDALVVNQLRNDLQTSGVDLCHDSTVLAHKKGLPDPLKDAMAVAVKPCAVATEQSLEIGGVAFAGRLPPKVELVAQQQGRPSLAVSSVVEPQAQAGGAP